MLGSICQGFLQSGQGEPRTLNFFIQRHRPQQRRKNMIRTADKMVIHSDDELEIATSVGGGGSRDTGGTWSPIINRYYFSAVKL